LFKHLSRERLDVLRCIDPKNYNMVGPIEDILPLSLKKCGV
jgi:hypothetical protein